MPNNIEFILAADLINAAGDCIEKDTSYNDDLIGALAEMQVLIARFRRGLECYWATDFNRRVSAGLDNLEKEDENDP